MVQANEPFVVTYYSYTFQQCLNNISYKMCIFDLHLNLSQCSLWIKFHNRDIRWTKFFCGMIPDKYCSIVYTAVQCVAMFFLLVWWLQITEWIIIAWKNSLRLVSLESLKLSGSHTKTWLCIQTFNNIEKISGELLILN